MVRTIPSVVLRFRDATAVIVLLVGSAGAWSSPKLACVVNSAAAPGATVTVHADVLGPFDLTEMFSAWLDYSTDNQATWHRVGMSPVTEPGFDSTFAGTFTAPGSGTVWYRVAAEDTFGRAFHSPVNSSDIWPAPMNLLAPTSDEPTGDCINNPDGPFLDLTGCWMTYSGSRFYARITNNDDEWPLSKLFPPTWYLYAAGFRNPDASQDTWTFAMAYGNILGIYEPGLYQVNSYTFDFEKFAEIDYQINGNVLQMRCAAADLAANPHFGPWPNSSGFLRAARADTRSVDISQNNYLHDTTNQSRWYVDRTPKFAVNQNQPPVLVRPRVVPEQGTPATDFYFDVQYSDPDSNLPLLRVVVVDEEDTLRLSPNSHRYWTNVLYASNRSGFAPGTHVARFVFNDGLAAATAVDTFVVSDTTGVAEGACPATTNQLTATPNPFSSRVVLEVPGSTGGLEVRDCVGRLVRRFPAGLRHHWDGTGANGQQIPAGVYLLCPAGRGAGRPRRLIRVDR
jgi:hypothetical protein